MLQPLLCRQPSWLPALPPGACFGPSGQVSCVGGTDMFRQRERSGQYKTVLEVGSEPVFCRAAGGEPAGAPALLSLGILLSALCFQSLASGALRLHSPLGP